MIAALMTRPGLIKLIGIGLVALMAAGIYFFILHLQDEVGKYREQAAQERLARQVAEETTKEIRRQHDEAVVKLGYLEKANRLIAAEWDKTRARLDELSDEPEGPVTDEMADHLNRLNFDVNRMLERATGTTRHGGADD